MKKIKRHSWYLVPSIHPSHPIPSTHPIHPIRKHCSHLMSSLKTKNKGHFLYQFFIPRCIDGWGGWDGMGWMDGWSLNYFFGPYLKNYFIFFLNYFISLKYMFLHIFWNIRRKKSECSFFQNISPKSTTTFFSKIFSRISQISRKLLNIFFSLFLVPSEE